MLYEAQGHAQQFRSHAHGLPSILVSTSYAPAAGLMTISSGSRGRSVSRWTGQTTRPGAGSKINLFRTIATVRTASCIANAAPMHIRGPIPNGKYAHPVHRRIEKPSGIEDGWVS